MVLTDRWPLGTDNAAETDDAAVITRSVAAALAVVATIEVIAPVVCPPGSAPVGDEAIVVRADGAFTVRLVPWAPSSAGLSGGAWKAAQAVADRFAPDVLLVCGRRRVGHATLWGNIGVPVIHLPLLEGGEVLPPGSALASGDFIAALVTSDSERVELARQVPEADVISDVRLHVPVPSDGYGADGHSDEDTGANDRHHVLVLCPSMSEDLSVPNTLLARLLASYIRSEPVVVSFADRLEISDQYGQRWLPAPNRRERWALMARARCVVDLAPGTTLALQSIEAMRLATPVVVPEGTRAHSQASEANGGLWFGSAAELMECIEQLRDPEIARTLGVQARRWADSRYGERTAFVSRVHRAVTNALAKTSGTI